jgi:drug/metabolite transporter (DMT)-like permease
MAACLQVKVRQALLVLAGSPVWSASWMHMRLRPFAASDSAGRACITPHVLQGQRLVSPADAQILFASVPVWSALLAAALLPGEAVRLATWGGGACIVVAGVVAAPPSESWWHRR